MPDFSTQCPALLQVHLDHLLASAIDLETIRRRGYKTIYVKKDFDAYGAGAFAPRQRRAPGILIPLYGVPEKAVVGYQYRPDSPRAGAAGRPIKYENPSGASVRIDVPPACFDQLGNPAIPLFITEGVKKEDALASRGACVIGLTGVWAFKGKNRDGGITVLADFDYIAWKDRIIYFCFDSDIITKQAVHRALQRLREHLERHGAAVRVLYLPAGPKGEKVGVDDYLAQGHSLEELVTLEKAGDMVKTTLRERSVDTYIVENGAICWIKKDRDGNVTIPLCNFTARAIEDVVRDNGLENTRFFKMAGQLHSGAALPPTDVPAGSFQSLGWVTGSWGLKAIIAAGQNVKDRLREALQILSLDAPQKTVFTHTGWRQIDGRPAFLSEGGAIGAENVSVDLEDQLRHYCLPAPQGDPAEAIRARLDFLLAGEPPVTFPL
ncbi:MAG: DUF3854 domain-containing protein, partial [Kiritimatiellota bacterium]|nr:DUF3854 domain-containing protein [Kiritimatiellota bacterium]